jgi:NH3-dependent NAD+ synthetase
MFQKSIKEVVDYLVQEARVFGAGCEKVYVSLSGGVDSAVVAMILVRAFGKENVVCVYRDIRSNPEHEKDTRALAEAFGFRLIVLNLNPIYDSILAKCREEFSQAGLPWISEGEESGGEIWANAYASLKSRMMTPVAGFISKAIDGGRGRTFGTGNIEEDLLLRYYDKFGDGAVDNNLLSGLTKMEVRQIALWFGQEYAASICKKIAEKIPSADLQANGDAHNDENELTTLAKSMGFDISLSYGTCEEEGNIAWITKQELSFGVVRGNRAQWDKEKLQTQLGYTDAQVELTSFMRMMEKNTRHKDFGLPGVAREKLRREKFVD